MKCSTIFSLHASSTGSTQQKKRCLVFVISVNNNLIIQQLRRNVLDTCVFSTIQLWKEKTADQFFYYVG